MLYLDAPIAPSAFSGCSRLAEIVLPDNLTKISAATFSGCMTLKSIVLPKNITSIGDSAFSFCERLVEIILPDSLIKIERAAFMGCTQLQSIVIPDGVTSLEYTFSGCKALKNITLPEKAISINGAFYDTGYYNDTDNWENGLLYIGRHLIAFDDSVTVCTVKAHALTIADNVFAHAQKLTEIFVANKLLILENGAFFECHSLKKVTLPANLTKVGNDAFYNTGATIYYNGTMEKWKSIKEKDHNSSSYTVVCTDGTIHT